MEAFASKFVTISNKKILGRNCSELFLVGTNLNYNFLSSEENAQMESKYSMLLKDIKTDIDSVKRISKTIIIKNGEPCLQANSLKQISRYAKNNDMFVAIETYGTKPLVLKQLIDENLVDIVTLKIYSPLTDSWFKRMNRNNLLTNYNEVIESIKESIKLLAESKIKVNARTIVVPSLLYRKNDIYSICKSLSKINNCTLEILALDTENSGKMYLKVNPPSKEFIDNIKKDAQSKFHNLKIK